MPAGRRAWRSCTVAYCCTCVHAVGCTGAVCCAHVAVSWAIFKHAASMLESTAGAAWGLLVTYYNVHVCVGE